MNNMQLIKNRHLHWPAKIPVLCLYLLFFTVQVFFNLDTSPRPILAKQTVFYHHGNTSVHSAQFKQGVNKTPVKTKIRLNKRFEPSSIAVIATVVTERPVLYVEVAQAGLFNSNLYASVFLYTHTLRGPPLVA